MLFETNVNTDFILDQDYININNGNISVVHKDVFTYAEKLRYEITHNPDLFYKNKFPKLLQENKQALAEFINADAKDVALTSCTTDSINAILRSLVLIPGDEIIIDNNAYISHRHIAEFVAHRGGARLAKVYSPFPIWKAQDYVDAFIDAITPRTRLVILEDICSAHGLKVPIEPIIDFCKSRHIQVLVAGSNSFAVRKVDVKRLGTNWYVGSCHKWGLALKGSGFIWASEDSQNIRPTHVSRCNHLPYPENFSWAGLKDYTPWFTIAKGIEIAKQYDEQGAHAYCKEMIIWAKEYMSQQFGVADIADDGMINMMGVVILPSELQDRNISHQDISDILFERKIIAQIGQIYDKKILRLSAYIFNKKQDYITCANAIKDIVKDYTA